MNDPSSRVAIGRLRIRSRRGMKELDVLLERYLDRQMAAAGEAERADYARLLEEQDPMLAAYLLKGESPADPAVARAVKRVLEAAEPDRA
jgi:antitoxin CptB